MIDQQQVSCAISETLSSKMFDDPELDKLELAALDVDLDTDDFDKLLDTEATAGMLNLDDKDVQLLMQHDGQQGGSDGLLNDQHPSAGMSSQEAYIEDSMDALLRETGIDALSGNDSLEQFLEHPIDNGFIHDDVAPSEPHPSAPASRPSLSTADLEMQKRMLMEKLNDLKQQSTPSGQHISHSQGSVTRNNAMQQQSSLLMRQAYQQQDNSYLAQANQKKKTPLVASVASIQAMTSGTGGESALQSFLRGSRKSMMDAQQTNTNYGSASKPVGSMLSQAVAGAPPAASIFSRMAENHNNPNANSLLLDMETIHSERELNASLSLGLTVQKEDVFASFGKSAASGDWLNQLSARDLLSGAAKQTLDRNIGQEEAAYASSALSRRKPSDYARSGMIKRNASEGHIRKTGLVSRGSSGRLSGENALQSLMVKKQLYSQSSDRGGKGASGSGGRLSRDNSLLGLKGSNNSLRDVLLPSRRAQPSPKYSLGLSRQNSSSVPYLRGSRGSLSNLRGVSPKPTHHKNAIW